MITQYGPNVRVQTQGSPFEGPDIFVEVLIAGEWSEYANFNSLSNDWAYTSAKELAMSLEKSHAN